MPSVPHIIRLRHRRREQGKSRPASRVGRIGLAFSLLLSFLIATTAIGFTLGYADLTRDLPPPGSLAVLLEPPNGLFLKPTRLYDRTGEKVIKTLQNPAVDERQYLPIDKSTKKHLPEALVDATIAAGPQFWRDSGFQLKDFRLNILAHQWRPATLAQQLVSDLLLWNEPESLRRSLRVQLLAAQITSDYGNEKVLEWYLNSANYGRLNYGAEAAAQAYFGKSASEITLAQAAVLAATAETPSLNPHDSPQSALEGGLDILQSMRDEGMISEKQYQQAVDIEIEFVPPVEPSSELAGAFMNLVLEQITEDIPRERVLRGGLEIITSLDYDLQQQANCAAANQVARLKDSSAPEIPALDGSACQAARLLPTIRLTRQDRTAEAHANLVILDAKSGEVLALVDDPSAGLDPAHLPGHPPGSLLTPFIYLTGFSRGLTPASLLWDVPSSSSDVVKETSNPDGRFHGPVRLRIALANDYLVPASQVLSQMGVESISRIAQQTGMNTLSLPSGEDAYLVHMRGGEVTLLDITQAYRLFASQGVLTGRVSSQQPQNGGSLLEPITALKVYDGQGQVWLDCEKQLVGCDLISRPVISAQLTYLMTHILSDETARWPSLGHPNPLEIGRPAAAKIGQLETRTDAWTVGYTPSLVVGAWIGGGPADARNQIPPTSAAGLWHAVIQYATRSSQVEEWEVPPGITTINVCDPSGLLPTDDCPVVVSEVFQSGNEPTHADNLYQSFQINRETGNLATIFTPPELIEERVYMLVPPEAEEWARQTNLPTIPESYDTVDAPKRPKETAQMTSPQMFASVSGQVSILGTAGGSGFSFYRLQIGQGLNPETWLQIGVDRERPVSKGQLGVWDTSGLSGLYALQLLVARGEQQVDTHTIQVRVDNQAPSVSIRYPEDGQRFRFPQDRVITFQAEVSDNLELTEVAFYIDGGLVNTLTSPPFAVPWDAEVGEHKLAVRAEDGAGNQTEVEIEIVVLR